MIGRRWWVTFGRRRRSGNRWKVYWGGGWGIQRVLGVFLKAMVQVVVQAVLLFGLDTWDMTPCIGRVLVSFHHRVDRWIKGGQQKRRVDEI